jgi:SEC-C motif-containing protein
MLIRTEKGLKDDDEGTVEFQATAQACHKIVKLHEASRFVKEAGQWLYVAGDIMEDSLQAGNKSIKVGRNCPCPCGSGQKYKKCCGPKNI